jgi:hypothetical protein
LKPKKSISKKTEVKPDAFPYAEENGIIKSQSLVDNSQERNNDRVVQCNVLNSRTKHVSASLAESYHLPANLTKDDPLEVLKLPINYQKALISAGITSVGTMVSADKKNIYNTVDLSAKSIKEICGYQLAIKKHLSHITYIKRAEVAAKNTIEKKAAVNTKNAIIRDYITKGICSQDIINSMSEQDAQLFSDIRFTRVELGEKLTLQLYSNTDYAKQIQSSFLDYANRFERIKIMRNAFELIPKFRIDKPLHMYLLSLRSVEYRAILFELEGALTPINKIDEIPNVFDAVSSNNEATKNLLYLLKALSIDVRKLLLRVFDNINEETKSKRNIYVLKQRCKGMKLQEIADEMGLTRERVRQLETKGEKALTKGFGYIDIDLLMYIGAECNNVNILTSDEVSEYLADTEYVSIFLYAAKSDCIKTSLRYNKKMDVFCHRDEALILDRVNKIIKNLPRLIEQDELDEVLLNSDKSKEFSMEMLIREFNKNYKLKGNIYHRGQLSLTQIYDYIMYRYYPAGMKLYDNNKLMQFRKKVVDVFGDIKLPTNNRAIDARLADISVLCGRGTYIHPKHVIVDESLIDEISSYINDSKRVVFSFNELYERFKDKLLSKSNFSNRYFLQGALKCYLGEQYYFTKDTISKTKDVALMDEIEGFIRRKGTVHKSEVFDEFAGTTEIMLHLKASSNRNIILIDNGWFLHAEQLNIEPKDFCIREIITQQAEVHPVSIRKLLEILRLSFPEFLINNKIDNHGKLFGVLRYMFEKDFSFSRPYIAKLGTEELTNIKVIKQHLKSYDAIHISDLIDLCNDHKLRYLTLRTLITNLNDEFLRTDAETLTRNYIEFDDDDIAEIAGLMMARIIVKGYLVATKMQNYNNYPDIGYEWNPFLLRSIVEKYMSDSIGIINIPTTANHVMNSIFVDPVLDIETYGSLIRFVLNAEHNNEPTWTKVCAINWLKKEGFILGDPPKCLFGDSIIYVNEY